MSDWCNGCCGNSGNNGHGGSFNKGMSGNNGFHGNSGNNGCHGNSGNKGFHGKFGNNGFHGKSGNNGFHGNSSNNGCHGKRGNNGCHGNSGNNGCNGQSGNNGCHNNSGNSRPRSKSGTRISHKLQVTSTQAPGAVPYVPTAMLVQVPMYSPQQPQVPEPTYITNYVYHQTEASVSSPFNVILQDSNMIEWVPSNPTSASALSHRAFVAGNEGWDGSPLWVIRSHHSGDLVPGKLAAKHRTAFIPYSGKEHPVHSFEVLCAPAHKLRWRPSSNGVIPAGAIPAGNTSNGESLYIGRARHLSSFTPGKVHPSHGCCYISFGGNEISYRSYEVLCKLF